MMLRRGMWAWAGISLACLGALPVAVSAKVSPWRVDFECQVLDRVRIPRTVGSADYHWYCLYGVTNRTGMDRDLALGLFVEVDGPRRERLQIRDIVDPEVQRAVEARTERRYLDAVQVQGRLRIDERKDAIAVFGPLPRAADSIWLYVTGLSSAVESSRRGPEYDQKIRSGQEVWLLTRGAAGATTLSPLARPIDKAEYQRRVAAKETRVWRTIVEGEGHVHYLLDDERLTAAEPRRYLEHTILRRRYGRRGDDMQPHLDTYRLEGEDWILAIEPLPEKP